MRKQEQQSKKGIIFIVAIIILIGILVFNVFTKKNVKLVVDNSSINFTYSTLDYKKVSENENEVKLESKDDEMIIKTCKDENTKFNILKDYKKMVYNGEEKQYKNVSFLSYNENENKHVYIAQISDNSYVEISLSKKENSNKGIDDIVNKKSVKKILDSFKIN